MNALRNVLAAVVPGGIVLDLQTVRPPPWVEAEGRVLCELDATGFFRRADANELVLARAIRDGHLTLEAEDLHLVLKRWSSGAALVDGEEGRSCRVPDAMKPVIRFIREECVIFEPCRVRCFRVPRGAGC